MIYMDTTNIYTHKLIYSNYKNMLSGFLIPDSIKTYIQKQNNDIHSIQNYKVIEYNKTTFKLYPIDIKNIKDYLINGYFDLRLKNENSVGKIRRIESTFYNQYEQKQKQQFLFDIYIDNHFQHSIIKNFGPGDISNIAMITAYENALKTHYAVKKNISILKINVIMSGPIESYTEFTY